MRKILYSPGYGAGWTTWAGDAKVREIMLTYQPIIEFIEAGGKFKDADCNSTHPKKLHPLLKQLDADIKKACGPEAYAYYGGADDLVVRSVSGRVRIHEYDGNESVEEEGDFEDWL